MRFLGIDYGTVRIGTALSDEGGTIAFPHAVYPNDAQILKKLLEIKEREDVGAVIIGESRNFQGEENPVMEKVRTFSKKVEKKLGVPVSFEPEFLTTAQVKHNEREGMRDAQAAAIILQSYLDKQK